MKTLSEHMKKQKTVLVADDDEMVRRFLLDVLRFHGFDVQAANDGVAALDLLKASDFE